MCKSLSTNNGTIVTKVTGVDTKPRIGLALVEAHEMDIASEAVPNIPEGAQLAFSHCEKSPRLTSSWEGAPQDLFGDPPEGFSLCQFSHLWTGSSDYYLASFFCENEARW